jgi:DNA-binding LytR/AlgR family response regulator
MFVLFIKNVLLLRGLNSRHLKNFSFVVLDDSLNSIANTLEVTSVFDSLHYLGMATNATDGIDIILEKNPDFIILQIEPDNSDSDLNLAFIDQLYRYVKKVPKVLTLASSLDNCFNAIKYGVFDYFVQPLDAKEFRKSLFRLNWEIDPRSDDFSNELDIIKTIAILRGNSNKNFVNPKSNGELNGPNSEQNENALSEDNTSQENNFLDKEEDVTIINQINTIEKPLIICVKSYGDYRYIDAKDVYYLQADNNSTDIHINSGEMITAFKTLKHFESVMSFPFVRIHNSYIVNMNYVSRIHTGNSVCHIKNTTTKVPFSKSYKENVDAIIATIASGNYLEI